MSAVETNTDNILNQYRVEPESRTTYHGRHIKSFEIPDNEVIPALTYLLQTIVQGYLPENTLCKFYFEHRQLEYVLIVEGKERAVMEEFSVNRMEPFDVPRYDANEPFRNLIAFHYHSEFHLREVHIFEINEKSVSGLHQDLLKAGIQDVFASRTDHRNLLLDEDNHLHNSQHYVTETTGHIREDCSITEGENPIRVSKAELVTAAPQDTRISTNDGVAPAAQIIATENCRSGTAEVETQMHDLNTPPISRHSTLTDRSQTLRQSMILTKDYAFLNVTEGDMMYIIYTVALYNILSERIQLLIQQLHRTSSQAVLHLSIPSISKAKTLKKISKHMKVTSNSAFTDNDDVDEVMRELIEDLKFFIIVLADIYNHLQPEDALEAGKTAQRFLQNCLSLCGKKCINVSVFSTVEKPRFSTETLTFIEKKLPPEVWIKCKEFGQGWTTPREAIPLEGYAPSFRGTIAVNPADYRPYLFGNWPTSNT